MQKPSYTDLSPIAAIAAGTGESALAVIRTSGEGTLALLAGIFSRPKALLSAAGNTVVYGWFLGADGARIDETLVSVYRAPKSYTGEEGADIVCHGGRAAPKAVLNRLLQSGFREALRGEFTFRAFINGKLDLSKAESVLEMVNAKTDKARENAAERLSGALKSEIDGLKNGLVRVLSAIELSLDYSELDGVEDAPGGLPERELLSDILTRLRSLSESYAAERLYNEGVLAVIAGKPNAGKSSIFNMLLKEERAIVSPVPGTTRDYIEAALDLNGIPLRLIDTAGLRGDSDNANAIEDIEAEGIRRSRALLDEADIALFVIDSSEISEKAPSNSSAKKYMSNNFDKPVIYIYNKIDIAEDKRRFRQELERENAAALSAKTGEGLPELLALITKTLVSGKTTGEGAALGTERQKALIDAARASIETALSEPESALEITAVLLKDAVDCLGQITGEVTTADVLNVMFDRFCVGK